MVVFLLILIVCCLMFGGQQTAEGCGTLIAVGAVLLLVLGLLVCCLAKRSVKHEKGKCNVSDRYGYIGCCTCWVYRRFYPNIHINSNVKEYLFK